MHFSNNTEQGFDAYRRERKRVQAKHGTPTNNALGYENQALRELEQVEEREIREQQLTREVHDFFAAATKQAAAIVEKVSHDAEEEQGAKLAGEVEGFLMDALERMNKFVVSAMNKRSNVNVAETRVEPDVKHLVGQELDAFRAEGSPQTLDAHLGQDPFATPVEDVQAEFRAIAEREDGLDSVAPIEDHLVAESPAAPLEAPEAAAPETIAAADRGEDAGGAGGPFAAYCDEDDDDMPLAAEHAASLAASAAPPAPARATAAQATAAQLTAAQATPAAPAAAVAPAAAPPPAAPVSESALGSELANEQEELEQFKNALKALVRQGVMQKEEARAAWMARLEAVARVRP
ncbi:MAG: hypothetical protein AB8H80_11620 [Planctomycetota bacterium]